MAKKNLNNNRKKKIYKFSSALWIGRGMLLLKRSCTERKNGRRQRLLVPYGLVYQACYCTNSMLLFIVEVVKTIDGVVIAWYLITETILI